MNHKTCTEINLDEYGGIIETMYSKFSLEEIPEKIKKYKERIDSLFSSLPFQLAEKLESFSENERNYLNSKILDDFFKIYSKNDPLEEAIKNNINEKILNYYINCLFCDYNNYFRLATNYGNLFVVKKLLPKVSGDMKNYGFILASSRGHLDIVNFLLEKGADIHMENDEALRKASANGQLEIVKFLTEKGADIRAKNDLALSWASENGHAHVVRFLLEKGANVHVWNDDALISASAYGHLDVVNVLLENGANIYAEECKALRVAYMNDHLDVVKRLDKAKAN